MEALKTAYEHPTYQFHIPGHTKGKAVFKDFKKLVGDKVLSKSYNNAIVGFFIKTPTFYFYLLKQILDRSNKYNME